MFTSVYSQFDNSFFDQDRYDLQIDSSHWKFHFDNLNYFRNTEYTSLVDKGSTFGGYHLLPYVQYAFHENAEIMGGLFIRYDFGNPQLKSIEPYFKFKYRLWGHDLIFGNLEGNVQHQLIEPMMDYEWAITDRTEQGLQVKRENKRIEYDFWVDWQTMIYGGEPFNEVFFGGLNAYFHPIDNERNKLSINGQGITVHKAGEIDESIVPNAMEYNYAFGLEYTRNFSENHSLFLSTHATVYEDLSGNWVHNSYEEGVGLLAVARLKLHDYRLVFTYWNAQNYQSPVGDRLYFTQGRRNWGRPFEYREMLGFKVVNEMEIGKNLTFLNRVGFSYNMDHNRADVILENYLRWHFSSSARKVHLN